MAHSRCVAMGSLVKFCLIILGLAIQVPPVVIVRAQESKPLQLPDSVSQFSKFDLNGDGILEIEQLQLLPSLQPLWTNERELAIFRNTPLVLVLVEQRIWDQPEGQLGDGLSIRPSLAQFCEDLDREGWVARQVICKLYSGDRHQDGLTLLALRRWLQSFRSTENLAGVVLVGSFPEASLVRRWIWRREGWDVTIAGKAYRGPDQKTFLRIVPESIAPRADIVLADLDGNWESIYRLGPEKLESIEALPVDPQQPWSADGLEFRSTQFNDEQIEFQDFFWIQDDQYERLLAAEGELCLRLKMTESHPEVSLSDRRHPNPLAVPDILVSRINPRHVAVIMDPMFRDRNGNNWRSASRDPQIVETLAKVNPTVSLKREPTFERRLLREYFQRNHQFRTAFPREHFRTAAACFGDGLIGAEDMNAYLRRALPRNIESINFPHASLADFVEFAATPAWIKGISAHSSPWNSQFSADYNVTKLEAAVGNKLWRWREEKTADGFRYVPSLADQGGTADAYVFRSLYESGRLANLPGSLYLHNGCEVNTPEGSLRFPYNDDRYGSAGGFQNAESILFFLNGVALASRSKTFYDTPRGMMEAMGEGKTFGHGWRAYFETESQDSALRHDVAGSKRTYPWSVLGDWTLKVPVAERASRNDEK